MKAMISSLVLTLSLSSAGSQAAVPEDCWDRSKISSRDIGRFTVSVDTSKLTKDELLNTLGALSNNSQVYMVGKPLVLPQQNYIEVNLAPNAVWTTYDSSGKTHTESLDLQAARINPEIRRIMELPGVAQVTCIKRMKPRGRATPCVRSHTK